MIDFLEIAFILLACAVFGFCIYQQGKRDAHSQARLDVLEGFLKEQDTLNHLHIRWNDTLRAQVDAMAMQECQRRMFAPGDVRLLYDLMQQIDAHEHEPERIGRGEGN